MKQSLLSMMAAAVLFTACASKSSETTASKDARNFDLAAARKTIDEKNAQFGKAMAAGDSATLVSLYHSEAKIYPPQMPAMENRAAMGSLVKMIPGMGIKNVTLHTSDVMGGEDLLTETGTYEMTDGSKALDKGKYMVTWKMEDGQWKLYRDIWNSDMAPSGK